MTERQKQNFYSSIELSILDGPVEDVGKRITGAIDVILQSANKVPSWKERSWLLAEATLEVEFYYSDTKLAVTIPYFESSQEAEEREHRLKEDTKRAAKVKMRKAAAEYKTFLRLQKKYGEKQK